jgi:CRISPR-associated endonuclease Csn1
MSRILGLDLGTNSIGWAVVDRSNNHSFKLIDKGVHVFQEGVKVEKGVESSKAAERTKYRAARRLKYRRRLRKIQTLTVLSEYGFVPDLSKEELSLWRYKKIYPINERFRKWQQTNESENINPYYYRNLAANRKLDLRIQENRFILGRAFYHLAQRRGFLSNRLEKTNTKYGIVVKGIEDLNREIGKKTLGQFFYECYQQGEKIRSHYTHRELHYLEEFNIICNVQELDDVFRRRLQSAIFFQRPLKSKKGSIGKCLFESKKPRCSISHPLFEEFRMWSFINMIRISCKDEVDLITRPLSFEQKMAIIPLFKRKSKPQFCFEDICEKLTPEGFAYEYIGSKTKKGNSYFFNYPMDSTVDGCLTISHLIDIFGENSETEISQVYKLREKNGRLKTTEEVIDEIWHVLYTFNKADKLSEFALKNLGLNKEQADKFSHIQLPREYASFSLKAIKKMLPWLRRGYVYIHAAFLAKMEDILPSEIFLEETKRSEIENGLKQLIEDHRKQTQLHNTINEIIIQSRSKGVSWSNEDDWIKMIKSELEQKIGKIKSCLWEFKEWDLKVCTDSCFELLNMQMKKNGGRGECIQNEKLEARITEFLIINYHIDPSKVTKLYNPFETSPYRLSGKKEDGISYLGSPFVSSIKNPMAMRCLHRLRKLLNDLLSSQLINNDTIINVEIAKELNDANIRRAIQKWNKDNEAKNKEFYKEIIALYKEKTGSEIIPSDDDIKKFKFWLEQKHICLYTGGKIEIDHFIGANPIYDVEHTIPVSIFYDNSQTNLTLCSKNFNQKIKRNKMPAELPNHKEILSRISHWALHINELQILIHKKTQELRLHDNKEARDNIIQKRHLLSMELEYWTQKYRTFEVNEIPSDFRKSQIIDTGLITSFACKYLKTCFNKVYPIKAKLVSEFRKIWEVQTEYSKKERINHMHHAVDAITIACITKEKCEDFVSNYLHHYANRRRPYTKPWKTFVEDVNSSYDEIIISHYEPDKLLKSQKKKLRSRGRIIKNENAENIFQKGDSARGSLHLDTVYGAIDDRKSDHKGDSENIRFVIRRRIDELSPTNIQEIIDPIVKEKIENALEQEKSNTIWMNKEKSIPINKVRCYATHVLNPIKLKKHRDISVKEYKRYFYVMTDVNYLMIIFERSIHGKLKKDFEIISNYQAIQLSKENSGSGYWKLFYSIYPESISIKQVIRCGQMVILREKFEDPSELGRLTKYDISKRLFKIIGLTSYTINKKNRYGVIYMKHHYEARQLSQLKVKSGAFCKNEDYIPYRKLQHNQFNAWIENKDFRITLTGRIIIMDKKD